MLNNTAERVYAKVYVQINKQGPYFVSILSLTYKQSFSDHGLLGKKTFHI